MIEETRKDTLEAMKGKSLLEQEINQIRMEYRAKEKKKQQVTKKRKTQLKSFCDVLKAKVNNLIHQYPGLVHYIIDFRLHH